MARGRASWFNRRDGPTTPIGGFEGAGGRDFTPPESGGGRDWVLALDTGGSR
jgi:hypothetical protein